MKGATEQGRLSGMGDGKAGERGRMQEEISSLVRKTGKPAVVDASFRIGLATH